MFGLNKNLFKKNQDTMNSYGLINTLSALMPKLLFDLMWVDRECEIRPELTLFSS